MVSDLYDVNTYRFIASINQHVPNVTINDTYIRTTTSSTVITRFIAYALKSLLSVAVWQKNIGLREYLFIS